MLYVRRADGELEPLSESSNQPPTLAVTQPGFAR
jgi:hypothetical protein